MPIDTDEFRKCLGSWPSGVAIVTSRSGDRIHGMTVSDFSGASLSPPLVTVCCNRASITTGLIAEGKCFAVNILAADQEELSNRFASKKLENVRFEGIECDAAETGAPLIPGAVVNMDCILVATHDAGDHVIYIGQIEAARIHGGEPLVYCGGAYRTLSGESSGAG
ncbi:MAG: flavin reductase family protein [bacterium]|nr:flavin reductase family protein [bacterium]